MHPGWERWLGTHFTPLVYVVGILFKLAPYPATLLIIQSILLGSSVYAAYRLARALSLDPEEAACASGLLALYPTYGYISLYEFEFLRFCIPFLLFSIAFFHEKRLGLFAVGLLGAILCREEVALTVFVFALVLMINRSTRGVGAVVAAGAAASFVVITRILMPLFQPAGNWHVNTQWFSAFGSGYFGILFGAIGNPVLLFKTICDPVKLGSVAVMLLGFGFLPLASAGVIPAAVCIGIGLLSSSATHGSYFLYYVAPSIPFLFYGMVMGLIALHKRFSAQFPHGRRGAMRCIFIMALTGHLFFGPSPISAQFWLSAYRLAPFNTLNFHWQSYLSAPRHAAARDLARLIPSDAAVSAEQLLLPLFYDRKGLFVFPDISKADYVAVDRVNAVKAGTGTVPGSWDGMRRDPEAYYDCLDSRLLDWKLLHAREGIEIYQRVSETVSKCAPHE